MTPRKKRPRDPGFRRGLLDQRERLRPHLVAQAARSEAVGLHGQSFTISDASKINKYPLPSGNITAHVFFVCVLGASKINKASHSITSSSTQTCRNGRRRAATPRLGQTRPGHKPGGAATSRRSATLFRALTDSRAPSARRPASPLAQAAAWASVADLIASSWSWEGRTRRDLEVRHVVYIISRRTYNP